MAIRAPSPPFQPPLPPPSSWIRKALPVSACLGAIALVALAFKLAWRLWNRRSPPLPELPPRTASNDSSSQRPPPTANRALLSPHSAPPQKSPPSPGERAAAARPGSAPLPTPQGQLFLLQGADGPDPAQREPPPSPATSSPTRLLPAPSPNPAPASPPLPVTVETPPSPASPSALPPHAARAHEVEDAAFAELPCAPEIEARAAGLLSALADFQMSKAFSLRKEEQEIKKTTHSLRLLWCVLTSPRCRASLREILTKDTRLQRQVKEGLVEGFRQGLVGTPEPALKSFARQCQLEPSAVLNLVKAGQIEQLIWKVIGREEPRSR
jgi:hypothetical protein